MRLDLQQHLAVEIQGTSGDIRATSRGSSDRHNGAQDRNAAERCRTAVAARLLGVLPNGVLVVRQRLAPAPLLLQLLAAVKQLGNFPLRIRDRDRRGKLSQRGRREQDCQSARPARSLTEWTRCFMMSSVVAEFCRRRPLTCLQQRVGKSLVVLR